MPAITDWLLSRLEDDELTDLAPGASVAPLAQRREAVTILNDLRDSAIDGLCHADVSLGNILVGHGRLFLVDPRGMSGEVAYDAAVVALKATKGTPPSVAAVRLAQQIGIDPQRTKAWMTVAEAARV